MKRKISISQALALVLGAAVLTFFVTAVCFQTAFGIRIGDSAARGSIYSKVYEVEELLRENFYAELDNQALQDGLLTGMVESLGDQYSLYLDREEFSSVYSEINGQAQNMGISLLYDGESGYPKVISVEPNSGAAAAGLRAGDLICRIGAEDCRELGYEAALEKLQGEEGTTTEFVVLRGGEELAVSVTRKAYAKQLVTYRMLEHQVGYLKIEAFDVGAADAFRTALTELQNQGAVGIIFDVRDNPGGELETVCSILDTILPEGPIVRLNYRDHTETKESDAACLELPHAVLINGSTYSAAELFAAAVKDYGIGTIVGETSYGKGRMQTMIPLSDGTGVNVTVATYDPPKSENFDGVGVQPDITVTLPDEVKSHYYEKTDEEDAQLQAAIAAVTGAQKE